MADVRLERLTKRFDGAAEPAVRELDLHIRDGEFLVLVGASGSGKSTALRMIAGLEPPTSGRVWIGGRDVTDAAPRDRDIAMVFQSYALYPHMTVRDNLGFGLRVRGTSRAETERLITDVAERLGLHDLLDRRPAALSGGQSQRVALGRALVREPSVFLFDEPLSNLDAELRVHTRAELVRLHRALGTTMVHVTHDQTEAMTMGQRVALLHRGSLLQCAPPLELYDSPADRIVATSIGSPAMNLFPGVLAGGREFRGRSFTLDVHTTSPSTDVLLGVRPEHIRITGDEGALRATILVVEPLGSETLLHCRTAGDEAVVVRTHDRPDVVPDQPIGLTPVPGRWHLFDAASGCAIRASGSTPPPL